MTNNDALIEYASSIDDSARFMCHVLINRSAVPAPLLYDLAGHLGSAMYRLAEVADHLSRGIKASPDEFVLYDRNRDPLESIAAAAAAMTNAASSLRATGECVSKAQSAVNLQGYTDSVDAPRTSNEGDEA